MATSNANNNNAPSWLSIDQVALDLGVSRDLVRKMIRNGELEAYKFGRIIRVQKDSITRAGKPLSVKSVA